MVTSETFDGLYRFSYKLRFGKLNFVYFNSSIMEKFHGFGCLGLVLPFYL
jgi:hypothetical protein